MLFRSSGARAAVVTTAAATFNNSGSGAASGTTFDGSTARTISYNTLGASPLAEYKFHNSGNNHARDLECNGYCEQLSCQFINHNQWVVGQSWWLGYGHGYGKQRFNHRYRIKWFELQRLDPGHDCDIEFGRIRSDLWLSLKCSCYCG